MNNNKKRDILKFTFIIMIILLLIVSGLLVCIRDVKRLLIQGDKTIITGVSNKNAVVINDKISATFEYMKCITNFFDERNMDDTSSMLNFLKLETKINSFSRMGVIDSNGILNSTDGLSLNLSDEDYFKKAMDGEVTVSKGVFDNVSGEMIFIYVTPIKYNEVIKGALYATVSCEKIQNILLSTDDFNGNIESCIIDKYGNVIVEAKDSENLLEWENVFENQKVNKIDSRYEGELYNARSDLEYGINGCRCIKINNVNHIFAYSKIENLKDHYILTKVESSVMSNRENHIKFMVVIFGGFISIIFLGLIFYIQRYRNKKEKLIKDIAFVDNITGGKTLMKFKIDVKERLLNSKDKEYALVEFDICKFKIINDIWGYRTGNLLLKHISEVLKEKLSNKEMFCRARDDLFIALLPYENDAKMLEKIKILDTQIKFFETDTKEIPNFNLSYGVYVIDGLETDINKMIDNVSFARETSKKDCNQIIAFYDSNLQSKLIEQKQIEDIMYNALNNNEFEVYLQPKYDINLEVCVGAEALVRWNNPGKGIISPINFIPLFEKNGFIVNLDMFIFEQVCMKLNEWKKRDMRLVPISVNISRVNLKNVEYFIKNIKSIFNKYDIPANLIEIEITESAIFDDYNNILKALSKLQKIGFSISLDDFGTGLSSLNILKDLPIDIIKLDREFLNSKDSSKKGEIVISNIVRMVNELDLTVICEGVETYEQAEFLSRVGCSKAQGYLYAKPMPIKDFEESQLLFQV